ncbi:MAG: hypothetical protein PHP17_04795 [Candidatus Omnitrophica bacterium]|nr:hypothetical protein [Candidatus Omnitrophota bacterium]
MKNIAAVVAVLLCVFMLPVGVNLFAQPLNDEGSSVILARVGDWH